MTPHLTEEELFDLLEQDGATGHDHLQQCAVCRTEMVSMRQTLGNFRAAVTGLAATYTPQLPVQKSRPALLALTFAAPLLALAGLAVFTVALGSGHPGTGRPARQSQTASVEKLSAQEAAQQNLSDEALLNGIDQDLRTPLPPSLAPLARVTESGRHTPSNQR